MITESDVLFYIKSKLGYPYTKIELLDEDFLNYINKFTMKTFSVLAPDEALLRVNDFDNVVRLEGNMSCEIFDPTGREILRLVKVYTGTTMPAHYVVSNDVDGLMNYLMGLKMSKMSGQWNIHEISYTFKHPNIIHFHGRYPTEGVIHYQRMHTFESIPVILDEYFLDLCLADAMILLGAIRDNVRSIDTQVGTIEINSDFRDRGETLRREVTETLRERIPLQRFIDVIGN